MTNDYAFIRLLRGIAALWVVIAHCMIWGEWYGVPLPSAKIAVDLFMLISGFLMVAQATARQATEPLSTPRNWLRFYLRRYFRLAPAYYVSLFLAAGLGSLFLGGFQALQALTVSGWAGTVVYNPARISYTPLNLLLHVTFLFGLHPTYSFSTFLPDWSLSLEMQFYLLFPALYLIMRRVWFTPVALVLGLAAVAAGPLLPHFYEPSFIVLKLQYFLAGMLLFQAITAPEAWRRAVPLAAAVLLCSLEAGYRAEQWVPGVLALAMWLLGWLETTGRLPQWFQRSRLITFTSDASYGVYLFHPFLLSAAGWLLASQAPIAPLYRTLLLLIFVLPGSLLVGYLSSRIIERPGIRLGKQIAQRFAPARRSAVGEQARPEVTPT